MGKTSSEGPTSEVPQGQSIPVLSSIRAYSKDFDRQVTSRWLGYLVRRKLNLITQKSHGVFVIPVSERPKLEVLFERYGVSSADALLLDGQSPELSELLRDEPVDFGDLGDIGPAPGV